MLTDFIFYDIIIKDLRRQSLWYTHFLIVFSNTISVNLVLVPRVYSELNFNLLYPLLLGCMSVSDSLLTPCLSNREVCCPCYQLLWKKTVSPIYDLKNTNLIYFMTSCSLILGNFIETWNYINFYKVWTTFSHPQKQRMVVNSRVTVSYSHQK